MSSRDRLFDQLLALSLFWVAIQLSGKRIIIIIYLFDHLQPENKPILRLGFATGGGRIAVSAGALVRVIVTARPGAIYRNMKVVLSMPTETSSAVLSVCRVWVEVGSVLPCVNGDELTRLVHLFSTRYVALRVSTLIGQAIVTLKIC